MPVDDIRAGMVGVGRTVFEGDRLDEFKVHILGVLRNVIGPSRNLILARLEGGPLANTGVIAGMSGSPVYIDGRLIGAVSYSLGQFSKEPIAGITPIDEMIEAATLPGPRRQAARVDLPTPLTPEGLRASLREAFSWVRPFADSPSDVQVLTRRLGGAGHRRPAAADLRRPITLAGFDPTVADPVMAAFRDRGFLPVLAGGAGLGRRRAVADAAAAGRPDWRRADERRPGAWRHRHGHRRRRRSRLRVRPPVLQPGPDRVPDDARPRASRCCRA